MRVSRIALGLTLASAIVQHVHGQVAFNCSAFAPTGTCGVAINGQGGQAFQLTNAPSGVLVGSTVNLIPGAGGGGHNGSGMIYQTPVNAQAFTATFTFVPNGKNIAFVVQNNTSAAGGGSPNRPQAFAAGAGCEAGFFQAFTSGTDPEVNNIFALELDQFSPLLNTAPYPYTFTYSSAMIYSASQSPCIPPYAGTHGTDPAPSKISTSPVPLNSPAGTGLTTTGHTYNVTVTYDGSNVTLNMFDVTAGGSCPGASCFTNTWGGVNIPALVGGVNTAYVGLTGGTNSDAAGDLIIKSFSYTRGNPTPPPFPVSIAAVSPVYDWQVLPGSVRHINATITNGTTNLVNWSVASTTGGASATLSASTNADPWVDVTIGAAAGSCSTTPNSGSGNVTYTVASPATVTVRAQSVDDTSKTANFVFDVCAKTTQVWVAPFYNTLYAGQKENLQSWVLGNTNQNVTWAITGQPGGGDGTLSDTGNRDAVFSATVTGRYTLTATSVADGTKSQIATLYVTGHSLPYPVTPNQTLPVDCTVDPSASGTTYEVGPARAYTTITAALNAINTGNFWTGSTVRIHNDDLTGTNPTTYHEYFQVNGSGTRTQPFRVVGCPDSSGNLPIVDAQNATGASWVSTAAAVPYGVVSLHIANSGPNYAVVEGLHIRNGYTGYNYTPPGGGAAQPWQNYTEGINDRDGAYHVLRGNDIENNATGIFTEFNGNSSGVGAFKAEIAIEGNYLHNNGYGLAHQMYLQGLMELVQFNNVGPGHSTGSPYAQIKDRGVADVVRYNYIADSGLAGGRALDFVENEDASNYIVFDCGVGCFGYGYIPGPWADGSAFYLGGTTLNGVTGWNELYHQFHFYGNVLANTGSYAALHYTGDHGFYYADRPGYLYAYNNTFNLGGSGINVYDTDDNGGGRLYEYPTVASQNNIVWFTPAGGYSGCWNRSATFIGSWTTNLVNTGLANFTTPIPLTWTCNAQNTYDGGSGNLALFTLATPIDSHLYGRTSGNIIATGSQPFTTGTYVPVSPQNGTALSGNIANMPVRFQFNAASHYASARNTTVTSSTGGIIGAVDTTIPTVATPSISPVAGTYASIQTITITDSTPASSIYYTLDGSTPTTGSTLYTGTFTLNANTTVKALAVSGGYVDSAVSSAAYTINLAGLWNSLAGWATCILPGCDPGGTGIPVSTDQTIRNATPSLSGSSMKMTMVANTPDTNALWYWFDTDCDLCTTFSSDFEVYPVSSSNLGALELDTAFLFSTGLNREYMWGFQYCLNGAGCPGGHNSWDVWDQTAIDWIDSGVTQAPLFGQWNHITTTNHRAGNNQVYDTFTLNGTLHNLNLTTNSGVLPMGWSSGTGFQFQLDANTPSGSQTYTMYLDQASYTASTTPTASTPTFIPAAGTYSGTQSVTILTSSGSVICYNTTGSPITNGTTGCTTGTLYTAPVSIASSETLYAVSGGTGLLDSSVASAAYVINPAATPTFSPVAGTYGGTQSVTISAATGTVICYNTTGSPATNGATGCTTGTKYTGAVSVATSETLYAVSGGTGFVDSSVGSAAYTITAPVTATPTFSPAAGTYTSSRTVTISDSTPSSTIYYTTNGSTPTTGSTVYTTPLIVSTTQTVKAIAAASGFTNSAVGSALYTISTGSTKIHGAHGRGRM